MAEGHVGFRDGPRGRSWYYTIPITKPNGAKGQEQKRGFKNKTEARAAMRKRLVELESGQLTVNANLTVAEYLTFWLSQIKRDVGERSFASYERTLRLQIIPQLGSVRLEQLNTLAIDSAYTRMLETGQSVDQVRTAHKRFKSALRRAVIWKLITHNPADPAKAPRPQRQSQDPDDRHVRALTDSEVRQLLAALEGPAWLPSVIALGTGLRRGEVLGLRWQDVDFAAETISVRQTVEPRAVKGGGLIIGPPKTDCSIRSFQAPELLLTQLREHRARQSARRLLLGGEWEGEYVLCYDGGRPINPETLTKWFRKARQAAELSPDIRFHDLRHTYATNALRDGVNITTVSKRLGHSNVSITLDVYSHAMPEDHSIAARAADGCLRRMLGVA